jgi:enoyl-CoA hydratase/carnithine racemase
MVVRGRRSVARKRSGSGSRASSSSPSCYAPAPALADELAASPPRAYAMAKEGLQRGLEWTIDGEWSAAMLGQAHLIGSDDFREGVSATRKKRAASFTGQ